MPLGYVLDENLRGKPIWNAIRRHRTAGGSPLDVVRVGDLPDLPLGMSDPEILDWAWKVGRALISEDARTLPAELNRRLPRGQPTPGIFLVRPNAAIPDLLQWLELAAEDDMAAWQDRVSFIP